MSTRLRERLFSQHQMTELMWPQGIHRDGLPAPTSWRRLWLPVPHGRATESRTAWYLRYGLPVFRILRAQNRAPSRSRWLRLSDYTATRGHREFFRQFVPHVAYLAQEMVKLGRRVSDCLFRIGERKRQVPCRQSR